MIYIYYLGDGVAERSKRLLRRSRCLIDSRPWAAFFFGKVMVSVEKVPPSPTRAWWILMSAQIENSAETHTC